MTDMITLNSDSPSVQYLCKKDKRLAKAISMVGPITYTPHTDAYAFLVHEIIEQMLSVKAAQKIYNRLELLCGGQITPTTIATLSDEEIRGTGTSTAKVAYIQNITNALLTGVIDFDAIKKEPDEEVRKILTSLKGIGDWTAKMYLIFVLDRPNILPFEDGAFLQSYRWLYKTDDCRPATIKKRCAKWKPYSSIASRFLYQILDLGYTKENFHLYKKRKEL